jgi:hypothetical protein
VLDVSMAATHISFAKSSRILRLAKQLDKFRKDDRFLGKFRMLGRNERRQGGVHPWRYPILSRKPFFTYDSGKQL